MTAKAIRYLISGRVQKVFYRASTQSKAIELGITGWVCNLPDGNVEVMAFGLEEQLDALTEWLWQGPPTAAVAAVETQSAAWQKYPFFEIK